MRLEVFARVPAREQAFATAPGALALKLLPPHGYAAILEVRGWGTVDALHSPIRAGRSDLCVTARGTPEQVRIVLSDFDGQVLAERNHDLSPRWREILAAAEERCWLARETFSRGQWQEAVRSYRSAYHSLGLALAVAPAVDRLRATSSQVPAGRF